MLCTRCGAPLGDVERVGLCENCRGLEPGAGAEQQSSATAQQQSSTAVEQPVHSNQYGFANHYGYAGFWRRFFATLVDTTVLILLLRPVTALSSAAIRSLAAAAEPAAAFAGGLLLGFLPVLGIFLYYALFESSGLQATPGKLLFGLRVEQVDGARCGFLRAVGRNTAKLLSSMILYIGFLMAGFTKRKQSLHDMCASCVVVRSRVLGLAAQVFLSVASVAVFLAVYSVVGHPIRQPERSLRRPPARPDSTALQRSAPVRNIPAPDEPPEADVSHLTISNASVEVPGMFAVLEPQPRINPGPPEISIYVFRSPLQKEEQYQLARLAVRSAEAMYSSIGQQPVARLALHLTAGSGCHLRALKKVDLEIYNDAAFSATDAELPYSIAAAPDDERLSIKKLSCGAIAKGAALRLEAGGDCTPPGGSAACRWQIAGAQTIH